MPTLYLFSQTLNEEGCQSILCDDTGQVKEPLAFRALAEIKTLQQDHKTWLVLPTNRASLFQVALPWLGEKKARTALPYALEDQLAQNVEHLHVAFDKRFYQDQRYLVVVVDKGYLQSQLAAVQGAGIRLAGATIDWFALDDQQACLTDYGVLVRSANYQGTVAPELIPTFLANPSELNWIAPQGSISVPESATVQSVEMPLHEWIGVHLCQRPVMNLCQGAFQLKQQSQGLRRGYYLVGLVAVLWILSFLLVKSWSIIQLNRELQTLDAQIAVIYKEYFPQATQVISPRFRISKLLEGSQGNAAEQFWYLLSAYARVSKESPVKVEQMRYQNNTLSVTVVASDFDKLEQLQNLLRRQQVQVKQTQATTQDDQVVATLELK